MKATTRVYVAQDHIEYPPDVDVTGVLSKKGNWIEDEKDPLNW